MSSPSCLGCGDIYEGSYRPDGSVRGLDVNGLCYCCRTGTPKLEGPTLNPKYVPIFEALSRRHDEQELQRIQARLAK